MKYFVVKIDEITGNKEFTFTVLINTSSESSLEHKLRKILKTWYGNKPEIGSKDLYAVHDFGNSLVNLRGWAESDEEEYDILKKYLTEL